MNYGHHCVLAFFLPPLLGAVVGGDASEERVGHGTRHESRQQGSNGWEIMILRSGHILIKSHPDHHKIVESPVMLSTRVTYAQLRPSTSFSSSSSGNTVRP